MPITRLQKVLARAGIASRRAAEALIVAGRVRVDGVVVTELGTKVDGRRSRIEVDGKRVVAEAPTYVVLNKPRGVVSTLHDPEGRPSVRELLATVPARVYSIGRLDFATSGVLMATNDGDFAEGLMHPRRGVPKTYVVKVHGLMKSEDLDRWRNGVLLESSKTLPAKAKLLRYEGDKTWFELTITEGRNQQVRRMGEATGFSVMRLSRIAFAGVTAEGLRPGQWRHLTASELAQLKNEYGVPRRVVSPPVQESPRPAPAARHPVSGAKRAIRTEERRDRGPHYGGGVPARRDLPATDCRGPSVRRGSSGDEDPGATPRPDVGGRGGRTRTTGTGGGIGSEPGTFRVRGRRG
jgi:23S rRNA pseudouridine2605 synthase